MKHPKTLVEALLGLCFLATREPLTREQLGRLVQQFLDQYPEVHIGPAITREALVELLLKWDVSLDPGLRASEEIEAGQVVDEFLAERGGA